MIRLKSDRERACSTAPDPDLWFMTCSQVLRLSRARATLPEGYTNSIAVTPSATSSEK
jgi:hypothetical protein